MANSWILERAATAFGFSSPHFHIASTRLGFEVLTTSPIQDRAREIEIMTAVAGIFFVAVSVGLATGEIRLGGLGHASVAPTIGAIALTSGIASLLAALRGFGQSVRFDLYRREIQIVAHNQFHGSRILKAHPFREVTGAYIVGPKVPGEAAKIFLRIGFRHEFLEVARGPEADVENLRQRLTKDLRVHT